MDKSRLPSNPQHSKQAGVVLLSHCVLSLFNDSIDHKVKLQPLHSKVAPKDYFDLKTITG